MGNRGAVLFCMHSFSRLYLSANAAWSCSDVGVDVGMSEADCSFQQFFSALSTLSDDVTGVLRPAADETAIHKLQSSIAVAIPEELLDLLRIHDGAATDYSIFPLMDFYSSEVIAREWVSWAGIHASHIVPERWKSVPLGPIKADQSWRLGWLPFAGDGAGGYLCLDLDPPDEGVCGQVISMWANRPDREVLAPSLSEWVASVTADLEQGAVIWSEDVGGLMPTS